MNKYTSKQMYMSEDTKRLQQVNGTLMFLYYFLFAIVAYQFIYRNKEQRQWKAYFMLFFFFLFPFVMYPIQQFIYYIFQSLFLGVSNKIYYTDE
uniref:Uncharacterized protein n=1 Tax=viral metagenome TaxID=1070528 RepID=A0A6C0IMK9_9ZZZZ